MTSTAKRPLAVRIDLSLGVVCRQSWLFRPLKINTRNGASSPRGHTVATKAARSSQMFLVMFIVWLMFMAA